MSSTYGGYAFKTGSTPSETADAGNMVSAKVVEIQAAGAGADLNQDVEILIPPKSILVDMILDTTVAHTSGTATLALGSAEGGAEYMPATDVKANGRVRPTLTATLAAMGETGGVVYARLALATTTTAVGTTRVTLLFIQTE